MVLTKRDIRLLRKCNTITKNDRVKCNCGRVVKYDNITFLYFVDINFFDWWMYEMKDDKFVVSVNKKPLGYIGYVPIVKDIVYYTHKFLHKKIYIPDIECIYCEEKENENIKR